MMVKPAHATMVHMTINNSEDCDLATQLQLYQNLCCYNAFTKYEIRPSP